MITSENLISGGVGAIALLVCQILGNLIRIRRDRQATRRANRNAGTILHIHRA